MIPYKKHPFIKGGFQVSRGVIPREIIGPRSIVRKGPVREGEITPSHFFNKVFSIWPKTERTTIPPFREPPYRIAIPPHKSLPKKIISSANASSDSELIGAGIGAILSILSFLL